MYQHEELCSVGVVWGDTLFLVGNLQSPDPNERPVLPTVIVMCQFHFPTQKWTRLRLRHAPEICHYPLLAACEDQLVLFGGKFSFLYHAWAHMFCSRYPVHACRNGWKWMAKGSLMADCKIVCLLPCLHLECKSSHKSSSCLECGTSPSKKYPLLIANVVGLLKLCSHALPPMPLSHIASLPRLLSCMPYLSSITGQTFRHQRA